MSAPDVIPLQGLDFTFDPSGDPFGVSDFFSSQTATAPLEAQRVPDMLPSEPENIFRIVPLEDQRTNVPDFPPSEPNNLFRIVPVGETSPGTTHHTPSQVEFPGHLFNYALTEPVEAHTSLGGIVPEVNLEGIASEQVDAGSTVGTPTPGSGSSVCNTAVSNANTIAVLLGWISELEATLAIQHQETGCEVCFGGIY